MKDTTYIKKFADRFELNIVIYKDSEFIDEVARNHGSVESWELRDKNEQTFVNFEIDKNGNCIGTTTDWANSFVELKGISK
jgi:hypothetical protein